MKTSCKFKSALHLAQLIDAYFIYIEGKYHLERKIVEGKKTKTETKVWDRQPQAPTFSGLALAIGFNSMHDFEAYEQKGRFATTLKRGRLRVEAAYELRLIEKPTGAIFALKSMGWNERPAAEQPSAPTSNILKVEITTSGPNPAANEKEVLI